MAATPRWGLRFPAGSDAADVPLWMGRLAADLDGVAMDDQGLASARPVSSSGTPGKRGRYYKSTDTGKLERDHGTGWDEIPFAPVGESKLATAANGLAKGSFSAYRSAALANVASGAVIVFDVEDYDTSSWYDTVTGRYTPQVAGVYRLGGRFAATANGVLAVYKNGALHKRLAQFDNDASAAASSCQVAANGTDYFELRPVGGASGAVTTGSASTYFQGELVGRS